MGSNPIKPEGFYDRCDNSRPKLSPHDNQRITYIYLILAIERFKILIYINTPRLHDNIRPLKLMDCIAQHRYVELSQERH